MEIDFVCERCGKPLRVDDALAGQPMECYHCHAETTVPQPGAKSVIEFACLGCGSQFRVPSSRAGARTKCPKCGALLVVPDSSSRPAAPMAAPDSSLRASAPAPAPQAPAEDASAFRSRISRYAPPAAVGADGQPVKRASKTATGMIIFWAALGVVFVGALVAYMAKQNSLSNAPAAGGATGVVDILAEVKYNVAVNGFLIENHNEELWSNVKITLDTGGSKFTASPGDIAAKGHLEIGGDSFSGFSGPKGTMTFTLDATLPNGSKGRYVQHFAPPPAGAPTPAPAPAPKKGPAEEKSGDSGRVDG